MSRPRFLTLLVHGDSGAGKSWLLNTAPKPLLLLDSEGRADMLADLETDPTGMTAQRLVDWDPGFAIPEESAEPNTVTVVNVQSFRDIELAYQWLSSGNHPFVAVGIDSLQETQQRLIESVSGTDQPDQQDWGAVLRLLDSYIRKFRDLRKHKTRPLWAVVVVAGSNEKNGKQRPMLQGQMSVRAPYHFDVVGYLNKQLDPQTGQTLRYMSVDGFVDGVEAKDNTHVISQTFGPRIYNPHIGAMLAALNPSSTPTPADPGTTVQEDTTP